MADDLDGRKEACRTYIEQTKLLTTLASAFIVAPAALIGFVRPQAGAPASPEEWQLVAVAELLLVLSILLGYVVFGSVAGSQHEGQYNVYRSATKWASLGQLATLLLAIGVLVWLTYETLVPVPLPAFPPIAR